MQKIITLFFCLCACLQNILGQTNPTTQIENDTTIYTVVQEQPCFVGGQEALAKWLRKNMKFRDLDSLCRGASLSRFLFSFVVEKDGSISNKQTKLLSYLIFRSGCKESVEKRLQAILDSMPAWEAGRQDGKPVRVRYSIPMSCHIFWED